MSVLTKLLLTFLVLYSLCHIYDNTLEFCSPAFRSPFCQPFQSQGLTLTLSALKPILYCRFWLSFAQVHLSFLSPSTLDAGGTSRVSCSAVLRVAYVPPKHRLNVLSPVHRRAGMGRRAGYKTIGIRVCMQLYFGFTLSASFSKKYPCCKMGMPFS